MTLYEAIADLISLRSRLGMDIDERLQEAVQLGIEAMKEVQNLRKTWDSWVSQLLPGETKEGVRDG